MAPLRLRSPFALGQHGKSLAKFSNGDDAQIQRSIVLGVNPIAYPRIRNGPGQFRRNVGIEQKTAHDRSTGRPVEGLRLKSRSSVRPLTIAHTSTRLFPPSPFRFPTSVNTAAGR